MTLRIYNTMTGKKEDFIPLQDKKVGLYVCGVTVYDLCHIGHARSAIIFDTIFRYLRYRGYDVTYVRNFTDIDDKIINRANSEGVDCRTIAERYIQEFYTDMGGLGLERPQVEPKATEHIPEMIRLISNLMEKGLAYQGGGDVFFSVNRFKDYGKLSGRNLEEMQAGARVEIDEKKENPLDFALWKASKPGEPSWDSPWGKGRPGWHIECSVMSQKYLGETFDIHGGGKDLVFPHHENEIAQSEGAAGKPFARYWVHNGFVNINKEKMSKSLGNFLTIKETLRDWHPEAVKLFFLSHHYRSPVDFSENSLSEANSGLVRFYTTLKAIQDKIKDAPSPVADKGSPPNVPSPSRQEGSSLIHPSPLTGGGGGRSSFLTECRQSVDSFQAKFEEAMDEDFNTAQAIGHLYDLQGKINALLDSLKAKAPEEAVQVLRQGFENFSKAGEVLGLFREDPEKYVEARKREGLKRLNLSEDEILRAIDARNGARKEKDWKKGDEIRNDLLAKGIILEDSPNGTQWKLK